MNDEVAQKSTRNESGNKPSTAARKLGRAKLLGLMGLYAAPLILAWAWFAYVSSNEGAGVSVNGELIHPAVPLENFDLSSAEKPEWGLDDIRGKWSMVYFADNTCDEACETALFNMRQIRLSTGRRMERVQRIVVTPAWSEMQEKLVNANEGLYVIGGNTENIEILATQFENAQSEMAECDGCTYLVDPYGNLMMRFSPDLPPAKILKDLKHLLKISRIG